MKETESIKINYFKYSLQVLVWVLTYAVMYSLYADYLLGNLGGEHTTPKGDIFFFGNLAYALGLGLNAWLHAALFIESGKYGWTDFDYSKGTTRTGVWIQHILKIPFVGFSAYFSWLWGELIISEPWSLTMYVLLTIGLLIYFVGTMIAPWAYSVTTIYDIREGASE